MAGKRENIKLSVVAAEALRKPRRFHSGQSGFNGDGGGGDFIYTMCENEDSFGKLEVHPLTTLKAA
jgi:hypothetical protein